MDSLEALNRQFFLALNADDHTSAGLLSLGHFLAKDTLYILVLLLAALWLWGGDAKRRLALKSIVAAVVALAIGLALGVLFPHQRPQVLALGHTFIPHRADVSFPSDHALIFFAIGFTLLAAETRVLGLVVLITGFATSWARIFMGLHFPLDIVGGFVVAGVAAYVVSYFWPKYAACVEGCPVGLYRKIFAPFIARGWVKL